MAVIRIGGVNRMHYTNKLLLLGSGELRKEVIIEAQRLGVETIAVDRYEQAPAMQVAYRSYVIDMLDPKQLREIVEKEKPNLIVPEIEAIATSELSERALLTSSKSKKELPASMTVA